MKLKFDITCIDTTKKWSSASKFDFGSFHTEVKIIFVLVNIKTNEDTCIDILKKRDNCKEILIFYNHEFT